MASSYLRRIKEFDSITPLELETRSPGVYEVPLMIEGNSILSTIFVESLDVGASVVVDYYDYTTGEEAGEAYALATHRTLTIALDIDRISVTKIHNKPILRATVTGGDVRFSAYLTVVSSFTSDLDNALKFEDQVLNILRDKGMPIMGLESGSTFNFVKAVDGRLLVNATGDISVAFAQINKRLYFASVAATPGTEIEHINYTVPAGKQLTWLSGFGASDAPCEWQIFVDGVKVLTRRSSYDQRESDLSLGNPMVLAAGQIIVVKVYNRSIRSLNSEIETYIYGNEVTL